MSRAIYGIILLYTHVRMGLETGSPSKVYVIDQLIVFKGLSGDKASSVNSCLSITLAATTLKFIKVLD